MARRNKEFELLPPIRLYDDKGGFALIRDHRDFYFELEKKLLNDLPVVSSEVELDVWMVLLKHSHDGGD